MLQFRLFDDDDFYALVYLLVEMCIDINYDYDRDSIIESVRDYMLHPDVKCYMMLYDGKIVGTLAVYVSPSDFNKNIIEANELWFFVTPKYRHHSRIMVNYVEKQLPKGAEFTLSMSQKRFADILKKMSYNVDKYILSKKV